MFSKQKSINIDTAALSPLLLQGLEPIVEIGFETVSIPEVRACEVKSVEVRQGMYNLPLDQWAHSAKHLPRAIDLRYGLHAHNRVHTIEEQVGNVWSQDEGDIAFTYCDDWDPVVMTHEVGLAGIASLVLDKAMIASSDALPLFFPNPDKKKTLGTSDRALINKHFDKGCNPEVFIWRLSALFIASCLAECAGTKLVLGPGSKNVPAHTIEDAEDWLSVLRLVDNTSVISLSIINEDIDLSVVLAVLTAAASADDFVERADGQRLPTICRKMPKMHDPQIVIAGLRPKTMPSVLASFSPEIVWTVARMWCIQNAGQELLLDFFRQMCTFLWTDTAKLSGPFGLPKTVISLPQCKMSAYAVLPLSMKLKSLSAEKDVILMPRYKQEFIRAAHSTAVLRVCAWQTMLGMRVLDPIFSTLPESEHVRRYFKSAPTIPLYMRFMQTTLDYISPGAVFGSIISRLAPDHNSREYFKGLAKRSGDSAQWGHIMPSLRAIPPQAGIIAFMRPMMLKDSGVLTNRNYHVATVAEGGTITQAVRSIAKVKSAVIAVEVVDRRNPYASYFNVNIDRSSSMGMPDWFDFQEYEYGSSLARPSFKLRSIPDYLEAKAEAAIRRSLDWYILKDTIVKDIDHEVFSHSLLDPGFPADGGPFGGPPDEGGPQSTGGPNAPPTDGSPPSGGGGGDDDDDDMPPLEKMVKKTVGGIEFYVPVDSSKYGEGDLTVEALELAVDKAAKDPENINTTEIAEFMLSRAKFKGAMDRHLAVQTLKAELDKAITGFERSKREEEAKKAGSAALVEGEAAGSVDEVEVKLPDDTPDSKAARTIAKMDLTALAESAGTTASRTATALMLDPDQGKNNAEDWLKSFIAFKACDGGSGPNTAALVRNSIDEIMKTNWYFGATRVEPKRRVEYLEGAGRVLREAIGMLNVLREAERNAAGSRAMQIGMPPHTFAGSDKTISGSITEILKTLGRIQNMQAAMKRSPYLTVSEYVNSDHNPFKKMYDDYKQRVDEYESQMDQLMNSQSNLTRDQAHLNLKARRMTRPKNEQLRDAEQKFKNSLAVPEKSMVDWFAKGGSVDEYVAAYLKSGSAEAALMNKGVIEEFRMEGLPSELVRGIVVAVNSGALPPRVAIDMLGGTEKIKLFPHELTAAIVSKTAEDGIAQIGLDNGYAILIRSRQISVESEAYRTMSALYSSAVEAADSWEEIGDIELAEVDRAFFEGRLSLGSTRGKSADAETGGITDIGTQTQELKEHQMEAEWEQSSETTGAGEFLVDPGRKHYIEASADGEYAAEPVNFEGWEAVRANLRLLHWNLPDNDQLINAAMALAREGQDFWDGPVAELMAKVSKEDKIKLLKAMSNELRDHDNMNESLAATNPVLVGMGAVLACPTQATLERCAAFKVRHLPRQEEDYIQMKEIPPIHLLPCNPDLELFCATDEMTRTAIGYYNIVKTLNAADKQGNGKIPIEVLVNVCEGRVYALDDIGKLCSGQLTPRKMTIEDVKNILADFRKYGFEAGIQNLGVHGPLVNYLHFSKALPKLATYSKDYLDHVKRYKHGLVDNSAVAPVDEDQFAKSRRSLIASAKKKSWSSSSEPQKPTVVRTTGAASGRGGRKPFVPKMTSMTITPSDIAQSTKGMTAEQELRPPPAKPKLKPPPIPISMQKASEPAPIASAVVTSETGAKPDVSVATQVATQVIKASSSPSLDFTAEELDAFNKDTSVGKDERASSSTQAPSFHELVPSASASPSMQQSSSIIGTAKQGAPSEDAAFE